MKNIVLHKIIGSFLLIFLLHCNTSPQMIHPNFAGCWKIYLVNQDGTEREYGILKFISESEAQVFQLKPEYHLRNRSIRIEGDSLFFVFENLPFRGEISADRKKISGTADKLKVSLYYDADATTLERQNSAKVISYRYKQAESFQDGLACSGLDQLRINIAKIEELTNKIITGEYNEIHSLLILKNNRLVFEKYFPEKIFAGYPESFYRDNYHRIFSVTKVVISALIGIAIDKKYIESVNDPVFKYFPKYTQYMTNGKEGLLIRHLLTHTSGIKWDEEGNDMARMGSSKDRIQYFLGKPLADQPGVQFSYCSGGLNILGEIIEKQTGMRLDQFAHKILFVPLGISMHHWKIEPDGKLEMGGGLCLRSRDMAKIGLLFLNRGTWKGKQVISEQWIEQSTEWSVNKKDRYGMGYCWWQGNFFLNRQKVQSYFAWGHGDQHIFIFPKLNMIIVSTAGNYKKGKGYQMFKVIQDYIL
jgi:CubicO group peptidase (beta-lactamase class C family)